MYNGQILDGRNRWVACQKVGVTPRTEEWDGKGSPVVWVICTNLHRRHLNATQRATISLEALPMLEEEAKARMRQGTLASHEVRGLGTNSLATKEMLDGLHEMGRMNSTLTGQHHNPPHPGELLAAKSDERNLLERLKDPKPGHGADAPVAPRYNLDSGNIALNQTSRPLSH